MPSVQPALMRVQKRYAIRYKPGVKATLKMCAVAGWALMYKKGATIAEGQQWHVIKLPSLLQRRGPVQQWR